MHPDHAECDLAIVQQLSQPHSGGCSCHFGPDTVFLPLHPGPVTATLATCVKIEVSFYGKDDHNANLWPNLVYLGSCCRQAPRYPTPRFTTANASTAKGFGPTFSKGTHISDGTPVAVVFFQCVTTAIGPKATLALNMPDFTRYAKYPREVFWTQAVGLCVLVTLCGILGVTVTSACQEIYGVTTVSIPRLPQRSHLTQDDD